MELPRSLFAFALIARLFWLLAQSASDNSFSFRKRIILQTKVYGGNKIESKDQMEYPWLVGFNNRWFDAFFCAGSLVSPRHVLSAAHCFQPKYEIEVTQPHEVLAMLGRYNVSDHNEADSVNSLVWEIFIHPEWNFNSVKFDADISVVVLEDLVNFSEFIRPVGLPSKSDEPDVIGTGKVVGWGLSEHSISRHDETPNTIEMPAVPFRKCIIDANKLAAASSSRTFCAGFINKSMSACPGDSGGGFYLEDETTERNTVAGIVSSSIVDVPEKCKTDLYTIYTTVANFVTWIKGRVRATRVNVVKVVTFDCAIESDVTVCSTKEKNLGRTIRFKLGLLTRHSSETRNLRIDFDFQEPRVVEGIDDAFPNLEELSCVGLNSIERKTFANMTNLKKLSLLFMKFIPHDNFDDLINLEALDLVNCKLYKSPFNVLRNLKELKMFRTPLRYLRDEFFKNLSKLRRLTLYWVQLDIISEKAFESLINLDYLEISANPIVRLPENSFKSLSKPWSKLRTLNLSRNKLKAFPENIFANLQKLEKIWLHGNEIEEISSELFASNPMLEIIQLGGNKLKSIAFDFTRLSSIQIINLRGNVCIDVDFHRHPRRHPNEKYYNPAILFQELMQNITSQCRT